MAKFCKDCGTLMADDEQFCPKCGCGHAGSKPTNIIERKGATKGRLVSLGIAIAVLAVGLIYLYYMGR